MLTCVLNAAEGQLKIIMGEGADIICAQTWYSQSKGPIKGAEVLTCALQSQLQLCKREISDIERFACVYGPGSFTGIRLTLGTVAAIVRITRAQNASIDYMQALAHHAGLNCTLELESLAQNTQSVNACVWVLTHARRNLMHCQCFSLGAGTLPKPMDEVKLMNTDEVVHFLKSSPANAFVLGSGFERNKEALAPALSGNIRVINQINPSDQALWQLAMQANYHNNDIEPLYVRPCDAVENLDSIALKQGMDPQKAHERLEQLLKRT